MGKYLPVTSFWNAELDACGFFIPWWLAIGVLAFLVAWGLVSVMEQTQITRFVWHLPLFFLGLFVLFYSVLGLIFAP